VGRQNSFFVRVSQLDSLSGLDSGFSEVDFVYRFFVDWMVGLFGGFGLSGGFQRVLDSLSLLM